MSSCPTFTANVFQGVVPHAGERLHCWQLLDLEKKRIKVHDGLKVFLKPMKAVIAQKRVAWLKC